MKTRKEVGLAGARLLRAEGQDEFGRKGGRDPGRASEGFLGSLYAIPKLVD